MPGLATHTRAAPRGAIGRCGSAGGARILTGCAQGSPAARPWPRRWPAPCSVPHQPRRGRGVVAHRVPELEPRRAAAAADHRRRHADRRLDDGLRGRLRPKRPGRPHQAGRRHLDRSAGPRSGCRHAGRRPRPRRPAGCQLQGDRTPGRIRTRSPRPAHGTYGDPVPLARGLMAGSATSAADRSSPSANAASRPSCGSSRHPATGPASSPFAATAQKAAWSRPRFLSLAKNKPKDLVAAAARDGSIAALWTEGPAPQRMRFRMLAARRSAGACRTRRAARLRVRPAARQPRRRPRHGAVGRRRRQNRPCGSRVLGDPDPDLGSGHASCPSRSCPGTRRRTP